MANLTSELGSTLDQIASLVNGHSHITQSVDAEKIGGLKYCTIMEDAMVIACVKVCRVSWYQAELSHLVVHPDFRRRGHGRAVLAKAYQIARRMGARVVQCTIRTGNDPSTELFRTEAFFATLDFIGISGKEIQIWQRKI